MNNPSIDEFFRFARHSIKFRFYELSKLPSAYFAGVRLKEIDETRCEVTVPFSWFSKNPFRSTYFACLSMAAELSTGALAMAQVYKRKPGISMLVLKVEADFFKKATNLTSFVCNDGKLLEETVQKAIESGEPQKVRLRSTGTNKQGEIIAEFLITWSFKARAGKLD